MAARPDHHPFSADWTRYGGAAGLAFVALCVAGGFVQGDVPVYTDGSAQIKTWFADNSSRYLVGYCFVALGLVAYLLFLATLVRILMRAEADGGPWSLVALLSGVLVFVAAVVSAPFDGTLALLEGDVPDDIARAFSAADYYAFAPVYFLVGILTLATSAIVLQTGVFWRALAWTGLLITAGGLIGGAAPLQRDAEGVLTIIGYITLLAFFAWTAGVSVAMLRMGGGPAAPQAGRSRVALR